MATAQTSNLNETDIGPTNPHHEPQHRDGILTWESSQLKDEDIITVTKGNGSSGEYEYMIWNLATSERASAIAVEQPGQPAFQLRMIETTKPHQEFLDRHLFKSLPPQLDSPNIIHVLISTLSGTGLAPDFFDRILQPLLGAIGLTDSQYNVVRTKSAGSVKEFARSVLLPTANEGKKQTVLMLSGDGGVVDTLNGLLEGERTSEYLRPILSQLPLGTGNALFHSLHKHLPLPSYYIQGLRTLLRGTPKPLPMFVATFSPGARLLTNEGQTATRLVNDTLYGAVVASYGLHATLVADSDTTEYRTHGDKRFGLVAKDLLFPEDGNLPHKYTADVTLFHENKEELIQRDEHGYILATLVSNLEKNFAISPASQPLDGKLRVLHFGGASGKKTMEIMTEAYNDGNHIGMNWEEEEGGKGEVGYDEVLGFRIKFRERGEESKWRRCCIDGLIVNVEKAGWMEVMMVDPGTEVVEVLVDV